MFSGVILFRDLTVPVLDLPGLFPSNSEPALFFVIIERDGERLAVPVSLAKHVATVDEAPQLTTSIEGSRIAKAILIHNQIASVWVDIDKLFGFQSGAA